MRLETTVFDIRLDPIRSMPPLLVVPIPFATEFYFVTIPNIVDFLDKYGKSIGANTFFNISEFIPFIIQFLLVFGFSYQFPIIMCVITQKGELLRK
jgi:sec-independent protein translocase protein TatC